MVTVRVCVTVLIWAGTDFFPPGGGPSGFVKRTADGASKLSETPGASLIMSRSTLLAAKDSCKPIYGYRTTFRAGHVSVRQPDYPDPNDSLPNRVDFACRAP